jgi:hypothetical protein
MIMEMYKLSPISLNCCAEALKSYVDFYVKVKICQGTDVDAMICFHLFPASVLL